MRCGSPLSVRVIEGRNLEACANDDFVLWRDPKVATAVVIEMDGGVVLGRRAIEPGLGLWCLPGGFVNDDEGPADAAARECREEVGATVEIGVLIDVYHIAKVGAPSMIGIAYTATPAAGEVLAAGPEMSEVGIFPIDDMPPLAFPSHRRVLSLYVRSRATAGA